MRIVKNHLELHFIMILNSFVPMAVLQINLEPLMITLYRMLAASLLLGSFLFWRRYAVIHSWRETLTLLSTGLLTSAYWTFLVMSAKMSNSSVALVGMATSSLWISFLDPLIFGRKTQPFQWLIGLNAVLAVYIIFSSKFQYDYGFAVGIIGSFFGALVTIINAQFNKKYETLVITFYQMSGGWFGIVLFLPLYLTVFDIPSLQWQPSTRDILIIIVMAFALSMYAYSVLIKVMKNLSPFLVSLVANLSPVYGIIISALFTDDILRLNTGFIIGSCMLIFSVFAYPVITYFVSKKSKNLP
jgi:drug/metabolite transporter (DMT)-like permease